MEFRLKQSLRWWWHNSLHIRSICCWWWWWWWWSCSFCWPIVFANSSVAMDKWHDNGCIDFRASAKNKWTTQHVQTIHIVCCCYIIDTIDTLKLIHFIPSIESFAPLITICCVAATVIRINLILKFSSFCHGNSGYSQSHRIAADHFVISMLTVTTFELHNTAGANRSRK